MAEIKEICKKRAKEIYGKKVPEFITERIAEEDKKINELGISHALKEWIEISELAKENDVPHVFRNPAAASLTAYLSGAGYLNPLPAHYLCACGYYEFPEVEPKIRECAPDLPDKLCPKCNKPLRKDGYDIPTECCFPEEKTRSAVTVVESTTEFFDKVLSKRYVAVTREEAERSPLFPQRSKAVQRDITEAEKIEERVLRHIGINGTNFKTYIYKKESTGEGNNLLIVGQVHPHLELLVNLEKRVGKKVSEATYGDPKTFTLFRNNTMLGNTGMLMPTPFGTVGVPVFGAKRGALILEKIRPVRFGQLIRIAGLIIGGSSWEKNALDSFREEGAKMEDIITSRDDVYKFLERYNVPKDRIMVIMDHIVNSRTVEENAFRELGHYGVPDFFEYSLSNIQYLFSRNYIIYNNSLAWQAAWYKAYYPEAFYREYIETYATDEMKAMIRAGRNKVIEMCEENDPETASDLGRAKMVEYPLLRVALEMYERGFTF